MIRFVFDVDKIVNWEPTSFTAARDSTGSKAVFGLGRKPGKHLRLYVRPSTGLRGIGQPNIYDWPLRARVSTSSDTALNLR
jgi:hypothetical protein